MSRTRLAIQECAQWLRACLELGWRKSDLDFLEALWWRYHDDSGRLIKGPRTLAAVDPHGPDAVADVRPRAGEDLLT